MVIVTSSLTDDLASLVKQFDDKVGENKDKKMAAFVIFLSADSDGSKLKALAEKHGIKNTPLTMLSESAAARHLTPDYFRNIGSAGLPRDSKYASRSRTSSSLRVFSKSFGISETFEG